MCTMRACACLKVATARSAYEASEKCSLLQFPRGRLAPRVLQCDPNAKGIHEYGTAALPPPLHDAAIQSRDSTSDRIVP